MKNRMKNLTIAAILVAGIFGITEAQVTEVNGEFSTDVTFGETTSFSNIW